MSQGGDTPDAEVSRPPDKPAKLGGSRTQWITTPLPIKRLFDKFPLHTYPANELPQRGTRDRTQHVLYVFTTPEGSRIGAPSFNPSCLKWQAYLKFTGIRFSTLSSNNHASPTGALPFLIPSLATAANEKGLPVPATKLQRWVVTENSRKTKKADPASGEPLNAKRFATLGEGDSGAKVLEQKYEQFNNSKEEVGRRDEPLNMRYDAYLSLLDNRIRNAWLYFLYLEPLNFATVAYPLYITPSSSHSLVRAALASSLRAAAKAELLKQLAVVDVDNLYHECDKAWSALSHLLGDNQYFFAADRPGLFDASVFAYTNPLLDEGLAWQETRMVKGLRMCEKLVQHRERILKNYFERASV